jgi:hypothetical protein
MTLQNVFSLARGCEQRSFLRSALQPEGAFPVTRTLRGRAKMYAGRYAASQANLLTRVEAAGYLVIRTPGPRGGEWSARYRVALPAAAVTAVNA